MKETNSFRRHNNVETIMTNKNNIIILFNFPLLNTSLKMGEKGRNTYEVYHMLLYIYVYIKHVFIYTYIIYILYYVYIKYVVNFVCVTALFAHLQGGIYIYIYKYEYIYIYLI